MAKYKIFLEKCNRPNEIRELETEILPSVGDFIEVRGQQLYKIVSKTHCFEKDSTFASTSFYAEKDE